MHTGVRRYKGNKKAINHYHLAFTAVSEILTKQTQTDTNYLPNMLKDVCETWAGVSLTQHYESQTGTSSCCHLQRGHGHDLDLPGHCAAAAETAVVVVAGERVVAAVGHGPVGGEHLEGPEHWRQ